MSEHDIINKRIKICRFKGKVVDLIWEESIGDDEDDLNYNEVLLVLMEVVQTLQVHKE